MSGFLGNPSTTQIVDQLQQLVRAAFLTQQTIKAGVAGSTPAYLTAAGSTQATATQISSAPVSAFLTVPAGSGGVLPVLSTGLRIEVWNVGANALLLYPQTGAQINALGTNAPYSLAVGAKLALIWTSATQWFGV